MRTRLKTIARTQPQWTLVSAAEAIKNLEVSLADDKPRALIQMATGSGKTFTAVSAVYRLIKFAKVRAGAVSGGSRQPGQADPQGISELYHPG